MNTQLLKYALEVERTGSITQAADNLFMAQPNLSKAIKELEDTLGIEIFKRTSKGMVPTEKGAEFLMYARNIVAQINEMESLYISRNEAKQRFNIVIQEAAIYPRLYTLCLRAGFRAGDRCGRKGNKFDTGYQRRCQRRL
jgi:DNA-binding transcriptional LysR family regulator